MSSLFSHLLLTLAKHSGIMFMPPSFSLWSISLSHAMRPGLKSAIFGGKMIELGKLCFIKTKFEPNLSCFSK